MNKPTITAPMQLSLSRADKALSFARQMIINDNDTYTLAGKCIAQCKTVWDEIEAMRKEKTKPLNDHVKWLNDLARPHLKAAKEAENIIAEKRATYRNAEELKRIEAERVRAIEQQKIEAKATEEAANAGSHEEAQAILTKAVLETPAPVVSTIPKDDGMSIAKAWKGECLSITELAASVATVPSNASFLLINQSMLNSRAREMGEKFSLPGCRAVKVETEKRGRR